MIALNTSVEQLVNDNLPLVLFVYKRCRNSNIVRLLDRDDAISAGNMGLLKAAQTFDPSRAMFSTHAYHLIRQGIFREARKNYTATRNRFMVGDWKDLLDRTSEPSVDAKPIMEQWHLLDSRERFVLQARCGIDFPVRNLEQIGEMLGISKERVRQVQSKAAERIRCAVDRDECVE